MHRAEGPRAWLAAARVSARQLLAIGCTVLAGCATPSMAPPGPQPPPDAAAAGYVIVAVAEAGPPRPAAGSGVRADYRRAGGYSGSDAALGTLDALKREHGLVEVDAWTILPLKWRCALLQLPAGGDTAALLARLAADPRLALAQPLNEFRTLLTPPAPASSPGAAAPAYDDPYLSLQTGFAAIDAGSAQRSSRGDGVTVAVVDTALDSRHPELSRSLRDPRDIRDFVGGNAAGERHATAVAGVIAAAANNGIGIVGVAPGVRLLPLRACWGDAEGGPARCNSFTLARALGAAVAESADVINLSLAGPRDPLLERLVALAQARGSVVVGAVPPRAGLDSFPAAVPGVLAVAATEDAPAVPGVLRAPGRRVLTLTPGGGYDYASGPSLATAHVSGTVALLRALDRRLDGPALLRLLTEPAAAGGTASLNACHALQKLQPQQACEPR